MRHGNGRSRKCSGTHVCGRGHNGMNKHGAGPAANAPRSRMWTLPSTRGRKAGWRGSRIRLQRESSRGTSRVTSGSGCGAQGNTTCRNTWTQRLRRRPHRRKWHLHQVYRRSQRRRRWRRGPTTTRASTRCQIPKSRIRGTTTTRASTRCQIPNSRIRGTGDAYNVSSRNQQIQTLRWYMHDALDQKAVQTQSTEAVRLHGDAIREHLSRFASLTSVKPDPAVVHAQDLPAWASRAPR